MNLLISIHPIYVEKILLNNKKFEFRRKIFKKDIKRIYVYATVPLKKVVGYFEYEGYLSDTPQRLWEMCKDFSGTTKEYFFYYFKDKDIGYAIKIGKFHKIKPIDLPNGIKAPQSYKYIDEIIFSTEE